MGFQRQNTQTTVSQEEPRINALKYEQSTFGATKSVVYGTNRVCGNIIDSVDFTSIAHTTTTGGGAAAQGKGDAAAVAAVRLKLHTHTNQEFLSVYVMAKFKESKKF